MQVTLPKCFIKEFEKKIRFLQRKAKKLGIAEVSYSIESEEIKEIDGKSVEFLTIEVQGETPKIDGWEFIATIDFYEEGNIIRAAVEADLEAYRQSDKTCDHCSSKRNRKNLYVVRNIETQETQKVGSSCLKDFIGANGNPEAYANYLNALLTAVSEETYSDYTRLVYINLTKDVIATALDVIKRFGYVRTIPNQDGLSTRDRVMRSFGPYPKFQSRIEEQEYMEEFVYPYNNSFKDNEEKVTQLIDFYKDTDSSNNFFNNIKIAVQQEAADPKNIGLICYSPLHFDKELEVREAVEAKRKERQKEGENSNHIGQVKERITANLTFLRVLGTFFNDYGVTTLMLFKDDNDNLIKWFSSSKDYDWAEETFGENFVQCKFTVKNHDEYQDIKSTIVNRLAVQA